MPTTGKTTTRRASTSSRGKMRASGSRTRNTSSKKKKGGGGKKRAGGTNYGTPPRNVLRNKDGVPLRFGNGHGGGWRTQKTGTSG